MAAGVAMTAFSGCADFIDRYFPPPVQAEEIAEIKVAIRKITGSPVISCTRSSDSDGRGPVIVTTQDYKTYRATKWKGKWYFHEVFIVASSPHLSMRWSELRKDSRAGWLAGSFGFSL
jgi:hypothetical protein